MFHTKQLSVQLTVFSIPNLRKTNKSVEAYMSVRSL